MYINIILRLCIVLNSKSVYSFCYVCKMTLFPGLMCLSWLGVSWEHLWWCRLQMFPDLWLE